jgi:hypothetical protein
VSKITKRRIFMADLRQTSYDNMGRFEALVAKIPGYKGYKEKEMRREADALLRQHLAGKFGEQSRAGDIASQLLTGRASPPQRTG